MHTLRNVQIYEKDPIGIQWLKTIGLYDTLLKRVILKRSELVTFYKNMYANIDNIQLYIDGKRANIKSWDASVIERDCLVLSNAIVEYASI